MGGGKNRALQIAVSQRTHERVHRLAMRSGVTASALLRAIIEGAITGRQPHHPRGAWLSVRLAPETRQAAIREAKVHGVPVSTWLRFLVIDWLDSAEVAS